MNKRVLISIGLSFAAAVALASMPAKPKATAKAWDAFWLAHHVSPPPPRGFMDDASPAFQVLNLTNGALSDATARRWAEADRRRGLGDVWASCHMRDDLVNAGVLGPPGLNGTDELISAERSRGTVAFSCEPRVIAEKVAVIAVSEDMKRAHPGAGLTNFVIVSLSRANGEAGTRTLADGSKEALTLRYKKGELSWQIDSGEFRDDEVVGPLWYQATGWSCGVTRPGTLDDICRLVQPD